MLLCLVIVKSMPQTIDMETAAQKSSSQFADDSSYSLQPFSVDTSQESAGTCMDHDAVEHDATWCGRNHYCTIVQPGQPLPGNCLTHSGSLTLRHAARSKLVFLFMVTGMTEDMPIL